MILFLQVSRVVKSIADRLLNSSAIMSSEMDVLEEGKAPIKSTQNKTVRLSKFLNIFSWAPYSCHGQAGNFSVKNSNKFPVNGVSLGVSGFVWAFGPLMGFGFHNCKDMDQCQCCSRASHNGILSIPTLPQDNSKQLGGVPRGTMEHLQVQTAAM